MGRSGPECRWWRGRRAHPAASRAQVRTGWCGAHSADHLGDKRRQWGVVGEVVCVVGKTVSDMVCRSHANLLVRALTGYIARKPALRM